MTGEVDIMKKKYVRPEIVFEDFSLTAAIAAGCVNQSLPTYNVCGVKYPGVSEMLFTAAITGCGTEVDDGFAGICYHVPVDSVKLFNSI